MLRLTSLGTARQIAALALLFSLFMVAMPQAHATENATAPETFALSNGMQVLVIPDHRAPVVTHMVWYSVGSADEIPGKTGLAHFLEHLMFKGTAKIAPGDFSKIVARNGGQDNAFTSYDYTAYFQLIARDRLPLVMEMEADRMTNLQLADKDVLPERDVVIEELRMRIENNPLAQLSSDMNVALYGATPYGRDIIGHKDEVAKLTTANALAFYSRYYTPNNATLIVAGDITAAELKPLAEKYYGSIAPRAPTLVHSHARIVWPAKPKRVTRHDERVSEASWIRNYPAPSYVETGPRAGAALDVLAQLLGGGTTSTLYKSLVVDQKIATGVQAWYQGGRRDAGEFGIYALPQQGHDLKKLEAAIEAELARLLKNGVSNEDVERAKTLIIADAVYARDDQQTMAYAYGEGMMIGLTPDVITAWPDYVRQVTPSDVMEAARHVLINQHAVTGELLPGKKS